MLLSSLSPGQALMGSLVDELRYDRPKGRGSGRKLYFDVGVWRRDAEGAARTVHAMVTLEKEAAVDQVRCGAVGGCVEGLGG